MRITRETVQRLRMKTSEIERWTKKFSEYEATKQVVEDYGYNKMVLATAAKFFKTDNEACRIPSYELVRLFVENN